MDGQLFGGGAAGLVKLLLGLVAVAHVQDVATSRDMAGNLAEERVGFRGHTLTLTESSQVQAQQQERIAELLAHSQQQAQNLQRLNIQLQHQRFQQALVRGASQSLSTDALDTPYSKESSAGYDGSLAETEDQPVTQAYDLEDAEEPGSSPSPSPSQSLWSKLMHPLRKRSRPTPSPIPPSPSPPSPLPPQDDDDNQEDSYDNDGCAMHAQCFRDANPNLGLGVSFQYYEQSCLQGAIHLMREC